MFNSGAQIGKYVIRRKLGQGGFGDVYAARDESLERDVALKFLKAEHTASPEIVRRFLQEARSAAKILHPGIVTVFECGQIAGTSSAIDGMAYIAMELLEGEPLVARLARSGRIAAADEMEIGRQLGSALEAAHRAGIVHRDLKPENVFLIRDSAVHGGERTKVLDFGIAKLAAAAPSSVQTQASVVFGTPRYMSPEQCRSAAAVDHRSDIYALGCILFELLCGQPPFDGAAGELIAQHILIAPPSVHEFAPETPPELASLIAQLLQKEPASRPATMAVVQRTLETIGSIATGVAATLPPERPPTIHDTIVTPSTFGAPPVGSLETTLSSLAGSSTGRRQRPARRTIVAVAAAIVIVIPVGSYLAFRGGTTEPTPAALVTTVVPTPPPRVPAPAPAPVPVPLPVSAPAPVSPRLEKPAAPRESRKPTKRVSPPRVSVRTPAAPTVKPVLPQPAPPPPVEPAPVTPAPHPPAPHPPARGSGDGRNVTINPFKAGQQ